MATTSLQAPDTKALTRWDEAFAHPIPMVRRMETQLRADVAASRERLRSLVGGSYRDLLGTADAIVDMDARMRAIEARVARIGRRCNAGLLERSRDKSRGLASAGGSKDLLSSTMISASEGKASRRRPAALAVEDYALASRLAVFKACADVIVRILRQGESLLLAAKVLALARILYRKLKEGGGRFQNVVESAFSRLGRVRSKLLDAIEYRLGTIPAQVEDLIDAMSAYALATFSSTADILRYFHKTRATWMLRHMHGSEEADPDPVQALKTWLQTLRDIPLVFPRQLSQALSRVKTEPLLSGDDIQDIAPLELDSHRNWLGDDIVSFVPYIRHDDLDISVAKKELSTWAPLAFENYLGELDKYLTTAEKLSDVAKIRKECLTAWFVGNNRIAGVERSDVLAKLKQAFSSKLSLLAARKCSALENISKGLSKTLTSWGDDTTATLAPNLWDSNMINADVSHGARTFTQSLQHSLRGHTRAIDRTLREYRKWKREIQDIENVIQEQRKIKWRDLSDDFDEDYDEEESRDQLLSKEDPDQLEKTVEQAVSLAINKFGADLTQMSSQLVQAESASEKSAFLLRFGREAIASLPSSYKQSFDATFLTQLYEPLVNPIVASAIAKNSKNLSSSLNGQKLIIRPLWNEKTNLPILPSPWVIKLVRDCHGAMTEAGVDLWTASCCAEMKRLLSVKLASTLAVGQSASAKSETDGKDGNGDDADEKDSAQDVFVQRLFDTFYLSEVLKRKDGTEDDPKSFKKHIEWLQGQITLEDKKREQMQDDATAYWKRTSLLFALLA